MGGRRNPSLFPLGSAVAAAQAGARGMCTVLPKLRGFDSFFYPCFFRIRDQFVRNLQERAALAAASDSYRYVEKRKPVPDPQVGIVIDFFIFYGGGFDLI